MTLSFLAVTFCRVVSGAAILRLNVCSDRSGSGALP